MTPEIRTELLRLEQRLKAAQKLEIPKDGIWTAALPARGGVYAIWEYTTSKPVYVGETCHLEHRLGDLAKYRRHRFRRLIDASSTVPPDDLSRYRISFLTDILGRKELEEFLTVRWLGKTPGRLGFCDDISEFTKA